MGAIVNLLQLGANLLLPGVGGVLVGSLFSIVKSMGVFALLLLFPMFFLVQLIAPLVIAFTIALTVFLTYKYPSVYKLTSGSLFKSWLYTHLIVSIIFAGILSVLSYILVQVA